MVLIHSTPSKCGLRDGAGAGQVGASFLFFFLMQEAWVRSLGWEDPLEKRMATHSSILAWRIPMNRGAWWATVCSVPKSLT